MKIRISIILSMYACMMFCGACTPPADPERDLRERYIEPQVELHDAGLSWPLAPTSYLRFVRGFYPIETFEKYHDTWRWASRHAELRVRAKHAGPLRLAIEGRGAHLGLAKQFVRVFVDGVERLSFDPNDVFSVVLTIAEQSKKDTVYSVEFRSADSFVRPNDHRDLAFSITKITWL